VVGDTFTAAGIAIDDVAHLDLYSCFPSAVQIAAREIGVDAARPLTVTGGLGFAGGPVNNYPTHAIALMVERLRAEPGAFGLTTALGWYLTKHAAGVWSTRPPAVGFRRVDPDSTQARVDAQPARSSAGLVDGEVVIEATSVAFDRDGTPSTGVVTALLGDGRRPAPAAHPRAVGGPNRARHERRIDELSARVGSPRCPNTRVAARCCGGA
jgi:acetyl-CoA C-acetyltransferase